MIRPHPDHAARTERLLNGWWDIQPMPHDDLTKPLEPTCVPVDGWTPAVYLVPGFFTEDPYPIAWRNSRTAWTRTMFAAPDVEPGQRIHLNIEGAIPRAHIFVNGMRAAVQDDMFIGDELDITEHVRPGENELAVLLTDHRRFPHPDTGTLTLEEVPWGCCISRLQAGIWQNVRLSTSPATHVTHTIIRTTIRDSQLQLQVSVRNEDSRPFDGELVAQVQTDTQAGPDLPRKEVLLAPGQTTTLDVDAPWSNYVAWSPDDPHLYTLDLLLLSDGRVVDATRERFGFREVWTEGHRILLNGQPQRWYGEWAHKAHAHWLRPAYIRQWYQQLRDLNMNYVRLHTFPHPEMYLDIADEMGILVCQETALYGSFQGGIDTPNLWPNAKAQVRRMVHRDANHPSLVIWSVENEMRWALNTMPRARKELPRLRRLFEELDPTRPAYHEGDSGIWNEREQPIISRHYGPACHGWGWWDRSRPLHAGELGRWHYGSPHTALVWDDDTVYADYRRMCQSIARDAARIIELGRANEVSCLFSWNTSGLDNLRPAEERTFDWSDPSAPHAKPLIHKPYQSEYAWWRTEEPYRSGPSFDILRHAHRPVALVPWQERSGFYTDARADHHVYLVNDLTHRIQGRLTVRLLQDDRPMWQASAALSSPSGGTADYAWHIPLGDLEPGKATIETEFTEDKARPGKVAHDLIRRTIRVTDPAERAAPLDLPRIGVWGQSAIIPWLQKRSVDVCQVTPGNLLDPSAMPILVVGEHVVEPGSAVVQSLRDYCRSGGRLLVLEQQHSLFPGLELQRLPTETAHIRDPHHPIVDAVNAMDLRFFGDDPFGLPSSSSWVTVMPYVKPRDAGHIHAIVDCSGGDFGTGGLAWAPVIETGLGRGRAVGIQLRLMDRLAELPIAGRLLANALRYLAQIDDPQPTGVAVAPELATAWPKALTADPPRTLAGEPPPDAQLAIASGCAPAKDPVAWHRWLDNGGTLLLWDVAPEALSSWQLALGTGIRLAESSHPVYHLVRTDDGVTDRLLAGLSNEDTCWLENWQYTRNAQKEPIASFLLDPSVGQALLTNAPRAGLDVLFGDDRAAERERTVAMSAYLDADPPATLAGLTRLAIGLGQALICQVRWRPDKWQFRRLLGTLLWNLGCAVGTDLLAGETTPTAERLSDGYPESIVAARGLDEADVERLRQASERQVEYCSDNAAFLQQSEWTRIAATEGRIAANAVRGCGEMFIGFQVETPTARKLTATVGGLPNPDLQTHLALSGNGTVRAWINGRPWPSVHLQVGPRARSIGHIADIDLEAGTNSVLIGWTPDEDTDSLSLGFEDKAGSREITFAFR
jgi:beta-galactosidase